MPAKRVKRWSSLQSEKRTREREGGREKRARRPLFDIFLWEGERDKRSAKQTREGKQKKEGRERGKKKKKKKKEREKRQVWPSREKAPKQTKGGGSGWMVDGGWMDARHPLAAIGLDVRTARIAWWSRVSSISLHVVHSLLGGFRISFVPFPRCGDGDR
ncbi:hypothetical protein BO79DRAFT_79279 [Aspergillus costaricaensis CBS 115574]|uniref:Uncharacterized protein n=1 Tax=Aspergillus costaricaensis CBS 115574 TaxID=1448317 RepID=A0ACD1IKL2_9EURO|nr:hypothetical protein BO79DRAFT_79279 [Aspergillus costaricaensis CBS 115574]RAK91158.1 hypothetical protein BO79DRAFT_79279 [Aspergillus costaricaensis CBS 115574]